MFAVKDQIVRDEGPDRVDLGWGCSGEDARSEGPVEESEQCGVPHGALLQSASCYSR